MDSILIVTQRQHAPAASHSQTTPHQNLPPRKHATTPFNRSKASDDISDMINEGLYLYEKTAFKSPRGPVSALTPKKQTPKIDHTTPVQKSPFAIDDDRTPTKPQPPMLDDTKKSTPVQMSPKRFVTGGLTAASPPVGWIVNPQPSQSHAPGSFKMSSSFGGRSQRSFGSTGRSYTPQDSFGGRSVGGKGPPPSSYREFVPFQHPSYELLKENGFIQHKYSKYHDKAIKGSWSRLM